MGLKKRGAEEARAQLPQLLEQAHNGQSTLITKHGKPYAMLTPVTPTQPKKRSSLLALRGTGAGLWGSIGNTLNDARDEWT